MKNFIQIIIHRIRSINILLFLLFLSLVASAQNFTVVSSDITITDGASMTISGNMEIISDININNSGDILIGGNWLNNAPGDLSLAGQPGQVHFNGPSPQLIGGASRTTFSNLSLNQDVELENETFVANSLMLEISKLTLNKYNLFIQPAGQISGFGPDGYVVTNSEGLLVQEVGNVEKVFPIGTSVSYLPATLKNDGVLDNFGMNLFPDVLTAGLNGTTIPEIDNCVVNTWNLMEENPGGSDLTLALQWNWLDEGLFFMRNQSAIGHFDNGVWNGSDMSFASGNDPYSTSLSGISTTGAFAVGDVNSPMAIAIAYDEQNVFIQEGWSGISSYLMQANPVIDEMLRPIISEVEMLQNLNGFYWPEQSINTLGNWDTYSGYQVKMSGSVNLTFVGLPLVEASLNLAEGWNLIPVLSGCAVDVADLFAGTDVMIVREVAGLEMYWPDYGINTLQQLLPGSAYMVYMNSAEGVDFPACEKSSLQGFNNTSKKPKYPEDGRFSGLTRTNLTHTLAIPANAFQDVLIQKDDYLGAFDESGNLFGLVEWQGRNTSMTLFGDDRTTGILDGFSAGDNIHFKQLKNDNAEQIPLEAIFNETLPNSEGVFVSNGISVIAGFKVSTFGIQNDDLSDVNIYPNPANNQLTVSCSYEGDLQISIRSIQGIEVLKSSLTSTHTNLDISELNPGIYFVKVGNGKSFKVERLIVQ